MGDCRFYNALMYDVCTHVLFPFPACPQLDLDCDKLQAQALAMVKGGRKDRALLLLKVKK